MLLLKHHASVIKKYESHEQGADDSLWITVTVEKSSLFLKVREVTFRLYVNVCESVLGKISSCLRNVQ